MTARNPEITRMGQKVRLFLNESPSVFLPHSAKPLTILHLTINAGFGGITRYICNLGKGMIAQGHKIIAGGASGRWEDHFEQEGVEWVQLPLTGGFAALWQAAGAISRIVRDRSIDIIHCHSRRPLLAARLARLRSLHSLPLIFTLHLDQTVIGSIAHRLTGFGDLTIVPAENLRSWVTECAGVDPTQVQLIPHGVDTSHWHPPTFLERKQARQRFGFAKDDIVAAYVGRFEYPKNEDWVLDLALECKRRGHKVRFLMCGDGRNAAGLEDRVNRELSDYVSLFGYSDPLPFYHCSDLLLLPSALEGFAYVAAEAAACGVAVLRTRTAGWQETVVDGVTGRVVDIDKQAFIQAALELLSQPEVLRHFGQASTTFASQNLSVEQHIVKTISLYRNCLTL
jgi:glycosyltransferase involved in cell wall biosynthesis